MEFSFSRPCTSLLLGQRTSARRGPGLVRPARLHAPSPRAEAPLPLHLHAQVKKQKQVGNYLVMFNQLFITYCFINKNAKFNRINGKCRCNRSPAATTTATLNTSSSSSSGDDCDAARRRSSRTSRGKKQRHSTGHLSQGEIPNVGDFSAEVLKSIGALNNPTADADGLRLHPSHLRHAPHCQQQQQVQQQQQQQQLQARLPDGKI